MHAERNLCWQGDSKGSLGLALAPLRSCSQCFGFRPRTPLESDIVNFLDPLPSACAVRPVTYMPSNLSLRRRDWFGAGRHLGSLRLVRRSSSI